MVEDIMNIDSLIEQKEQELNQKKYIQFSDKEIEELQDKNIVAIVKHFHGRALMKLPPSEIDFFEWLKKNDNAVWNDLWEDEPDMYQVSIDLLPQFSSKRNGFPICDLQDGMNYYFTVKHIKQEGLEQMQDIIKKLENKEKLKIDELVLYELHLAPFDIWHFSFRYKLPLDKVKQLISDMEYKGWIVHLPNSEDLLRYIEV